MAEEKRSQTYESLITISLAGFKFLALANGGGAVALLTYLGNIASKAQEIDMCRTPNMGWPIGCFLIGLIICGLSLLSSYLTQLKLLNEENKKPLNEENKNPLNEENKNPILSHLPLYRTKMPHP